MEYTLSITYDDDSLREILVTDAHNNTLLLSTLCPKERELRLLDSALKERAKYQEQVGIVLFGVGSGIIQKQLQDMDIPFCILDIEGIAHNEESSFSIPYSDESDPSHISALQSTIFKWQIKHKGIGFISILHPFHKKLYKEYSDVAHLFANNAKVNLFKEMRARPRFELNRPLRMLIIPDYYCMTVNISNAASMLGIEMRDVLLTGYNITEEWYVNFLKTAVEFQPDFILTFNHLGISQSYNNVVTNIAESLGIPVASWFVDSPDVLIGYEQQHCSSIVHVFLWEKTRVEEVKALGYHASYLPLATDPLSFYPVKKKAIPKHLLQYKTHLLFVGAVSVNYGLKLLARNIFPYALLKKLPQLYKEFCLSPIIGVKEFLDTRNIPEYDNLRVSEKKEFSAYFFFFMHTERRVKFMLDIIDLNPTIAGEEGWHSVLPKSMFNKILPTVDYVLDLTCVYQLADINLNTTSPQMKHAVNQRVFDVPISDAFVLTDNQPALHECFDVGKEIICYNSIDELKELYRFYIRNPKARRKVIDAGRKRIQEEHLYIHRLQQMIDVMREQFGIKKHT